MKNKFGLNDSQDTLIINDNYGRNIFLGNLLLIIKVVVAILILTKSNFNLNELISQIYIIIGSICLIALIWFQLKRTTDSTIPIHLIHKFKTRNIVGGKRYTLKLKNGKSRDLVFYGDDYTKELDSLKELLTKCNIPVY